MTAVEPTGEHMPVIERWDDHPVDTRCAGCGQDCQRAALTKLAYTYELCSCDEVDYEHLVPCMWHTLCLREGAMELSQRHLLMDAAKALGTDGGWAAAKKRRMALRRSIVELLDLADQSDET